MKKREKIIPGNLKLFDMTNYKIDMDKPVCIGQKNLDLRKILICEFYCDNIIPIIIKFVT